MQTTPSYTAALHTCIQHLNEFSNRSVVTKKGHHVTKLLSSHNFNNPSSIKGWMDKVHQHRTVETRRKSTNPATVGVLGFGNRCDQFGKDKGMAMAVN